MVTRRGCERCRTTASRGVVLSNRDEAVGILPLSQLLLEPLALVHDDLAVVREGDLVPFEGAGGGTLEVDARDIEPAAVARALELLLASQPVGRTPQVGADRLDHVEDVLAVVAVGADHPETPLGLETFVNVFLVEVGGEPDLDRARG